MKGCGTLEIMFRRRQDREATLREFLEAREERHFDRAAAIYTANPDLQPDFDKIDHDLYLRSAVHR